MEKNKEKLSQGHHLHYTYDGNIATNVDFHSHRYLHMYSSGCVARFSALPGPLRWTILKKIIIIMYTVYKLNIYKYI